MDLRQLIYLDAVVETGTFAAAAEREHIAQPALWAQVRSLEREWSVPLLERAGRRVRPTPALLALRPRIRAILADAARLREQVDETRTGRAGPVRIPSTTYPQLANFVAEAIATYARVYPEAPLPTRVPIGTASVTAALARGDVDLAIGVAPEESGLQSAPLFAVELVALGPGIRSGPLDLRDLAERPLALLTREYQSRRFIEDAFRLERLVPRIAYEDVYPEALVVLARRGVAVAVLVNDALPKDVTLPVATLRHRGSTFSGQLAVLWRDEAALSTSAQRFRDVLVSSGRDFRPAIGRRRVRAASRTPRPRARRAR